MVDQFKEVKNGYNISMYIVYYVNDKGDTLDLVTSGTSLEFALGVATRVLDRKGISTDAIKEVREYKLIARHIRN